jgi:hypothetical protein
MKLALLAFLTVCRSSEHGCVCSPAIKLAALIVQGSTLKHR